MIPVGEPVPESFDACETLRGVQGHGTRVVADLMKTAPGIRLFITNPPNKEYLEYAVDWLTGQASGKGPHNVDIINHSVAYRWDGSGDGTSTFDTSGRRSPLNIAEDAVERGALWINGAGNGADRTHFLVVPDFPDDGTVERCLAVQLVAGTAYEFQARWADVWPRAVVDLEIELYGPDGDRVGMSKGKQSGRGSHYPLENLTYTAKESGQYCIGLSKDADDVDPRWAQLQIYLPRTLEFPHHSSRGSLDNPAEFYDLRALAVGVARYHPPAAGAAPPAMPALSLSNSSARGPVPAYFESSRHVKPDVVGVRSLRVNTSQAAAHVSGVAALLLQAFEGDPTVGELAGAVRGHAVQYGIGFANDDWGHGAVFLPSLEAPEIAVVTHEHCAVTPNLRVWFNHPSQAGPVRFQLKAQQVGEGGAAYEGMAGGNPGRVDVFTDRGTFNVTARACTEAGHCGPESDPFEYSTVAKVCKPSWLDAVPQDEAVTLQWNPDPDATGYEIDGVAGVVTGTERVISSLTNGTWYEYRVRSLGSGGPSDWSSRVRVAPSAYSGRPEGPTGLEVKTNISRRFPGTSLQWGAPSRSYLPEIRITGGETRRWERVPVGSVDDDSPYSAMMFGRRTFVPGDVLGAQPTVVREGAVIVSGLTPGTEYRFAVRSARYRDSSNRSDHSSWGSVVTLTTPGVRPADALGQATAPPLKAPPEDLMAEVSGTTVNLTWTATTNPNYVEQVIRWRDLSVRPPEWNEIDVGLEDTSYTHQGLTSGKTYRYRVRAYKDRANDRYGEEVGGWADAVIP